MEFLIDICTSDARGVEQFLFPDLPNERNKEIKLANTDASLVTLIGLTNAQRHTPLPLPLHPLPSNCSFFMLAPLRSQLSF